jgi:hypothetical protein
MIDHCGFSVPRSRYAEICAFYDTALAPLGYEQVVGIPNIFAGWGTRGPRDDEVKCAFAIAAKDENVRMGGSHFAFHAKDHEGVDKFHEQAIIAGGTCNGKPGIRKEYHENYYGAFVVDPVG